MTTASTASASGRAMPCSSLKRMFRKPMMTLLLRRQRRRGRNLEQRWVKRVVVEEHQVVGGLASCLQDEHEPVAGGDVLRLRQAEGESQAARAGRPARDVVDERAERAILPDAIP